MSVSHLLIKYHNNLLAEKTSNRLDFINVPPYTKHSSSFSNISIFISLLLNSLIDENYNSKVTLNFFDWEEQFDIFDPNYLYELEPSTYIYDLDEFLSDYPSLEEKISSSLSNKPKNLTFRSIESLYNLSTTKPHKEDDTYIQEEIPYTYHFSPEDEYLNLKLDDTIHYLYIPRTDKDVLLLYSGGKDSTLSAIRLHNAGYNVHFIHFDNGSMKDQDKPYLTYRKTFKPEDGYYFSYLHKSVDTSYLFSSLYQGYKPSTDSSFDSEIRCLTCRMSMYIETIRIAKKEGFKYIAEGARISQKFMLEQPPILDRVAELTNTHGIKLLLPVLDLSNDQEEIEEIISNGYSSKTWESKCLIGKPAKDKTKEDEQKILSYFNNSIYPYMNKTN